MDLVRGGSFRGRRPTFLRPLETVALVAISVAGSAAVAAVATGPAPEQTPPGPIALVDAWARTSPISGLRCSGIRLDPNRVATARHCLTGHRLAIVDGGSLCDPIADSGAKPSVAVPTHDPFVRGDLAILTMDHPTERPELTIEPPVAGHAVVWGYGVGPGEGRPSCRPSLYRGELGACDAPTADGHWCLTAAPDVQLCGGSSGAPVFRETDAGWILIGVVSRGPPCGEPGPVVLATFPDRS